MVADELPAHVVPLRLARPSSTCAWLVWAAATGGALFFVLLLGSNVPYWDEWTLVPFVTGSQPVTLDFLWSLHNEHRIPLPRLIYLGLFALFHDFRAGMVWNVLTLSAAAALLIRAARDARGRGTCTDAFLALALLNLGHADNMLWSFQIVFVMAALLVALVLATAVGVRGAPSRARVIGIAWPMILAPLCGGAGVPLAAVAGAWLSWWALRGSPAGTASGEGRPQGASRVLLASLGLACWGVVAAYLYRYHGSSGHPAPAGVRAALRGAMEFLSVVPGSAGGSLWPWSGAAALGLVLATTAAVVAWWRRSREDRPAAEGLLAALAALVALALTIGWGRSGFGPGAAMAGRYATLAAPIGLWVYLAWCRLPWLRLGRAVQIGCFLASLTLYPGNFRAGRELGYIRRAGLQALVQDVRRRMPLAEVATRHAGDAHPHPPTLHEGLIMLRRSRLGPFSPGEDAARFRQRFPFLKPPLVAVHEGATSIRADRVEGRPVIVVAADGDLVFDVHPGIHLVSGFYGLLPAAYALESQPGERPYDGTFYQATFVPDEGESVVLFSRSIHPQRNPQERGLLPFRVLLPEGGGRLVLSTRCGPPDVADAGCQRDWGFWAEIDLR